MTPSIETQHCAEEVVNMNEPTKNEIRRSEQVSLSFSEAIFQACQGSATHYLHVIFLGQARETWCCRQHRTCL
jgi:hypothetical protein